MNPQTTTAAHVCAWLVGVFWENWVLTRCVQWCCDCSGRHTHQLYCCGYTNKFLDGWQIEVQVIWKSGKCEWKKIQFGSEGPRFGQHCVAFSFFGLRPTAGRLWSVPKILPVSATYKETGFKMQKVAGGMFLWVKLGQNCQESSWERQRLPNATALMLPVYHTRVVEQMHPLRWG